MYVCVCVHAQVCVWFRFSGKHIDCTHTGIWEEKENRREESKQYSE